MLNLRLHSEITSFLSSFQFQTYSSLILYLLFAIILCGILAAAAYIFSLSASQDTEKRSEYECGFEPFDSATRLPFDVHFYLVGILFLIFDVEIALLFPWVLGLRASGWYSFYAMVFFILLLGLGFLYEWKRGALIWPSRLSEVQYRATHVRQSTLQSCTLFSLFWVEALLRWLLGIPAPDPLAQFPPMTKILPHLWKSVLHADDSWLHYIISLVPEFILFSFIVYALGRIAIYYEGTKEKKEMTLYITRQLCLCLVAVAFLYSLQLIFVLHETLFHGYFIVNRFTTTVKILTVLSCAFVLLNSTKYIVFHRKHLLEYPIMLGLAILLILLMISAGHLISAFIALIGFSLNIYVLILFDAHNASAREAGIKYFYLSAFSSGLLLYGIFLLFFVTGAGNFYDIQIILTCVQELQTAGYELVQLSISFILFGLFFKLSAFPGHLWAADVYEGSPDPIVAFFILPSKIAIFGFTLNLLVSAFTPISNIWQPLVALSTVGSLIWGCLAAVPELKTKRFLAYASINQVGFLLLGIATNTAEAFRSAILYLFLYMIMNIIFLSIYLGFPAGTVRNFKYLTDFRRLPHIIGDIPSILFITSLFSMAGIPPLAGFFGKYYLLLHAQEAGLYGLVGVGLLTSLVSTYYYLRLIKIAVFENPKNSLPTPQIGYKFEWATLVPAGVILWGFIFCATPIITLMDEASLDLIALVPHLTADGHKAWIEDRPFANPPYQIWRWTPWF